MCDLVVSLYLFLILYCSDKYITQKICNEIIAGSVAALRLIPNWFVTRKIIKNIYTALYADDGLLSFDEDSGDASLFCDGMGILSVNFNNINLIIILMILILLF